MFDIFNWHTTDYLAKAWGKTRRTIQVWCTNGFLIECGFKVMQTGHTSHGQRLWLVYIPAETEAAKRSLDSVLAI